MKLMFDCQEVSRRLSEAQDRPLPTADRARMRLHLMMCRSCRNVEEQFDFIRRAMRRLGEDEGEGEIPRR